MENNEDGLYEGDIMLQGGLASNDNADVVVHNARNDGHWKEYGNGVIPYVISGNFTDDQIYFLESESYGMKTLPINTATEKLN